MLEVRDLDFVIGNNRPVLFRIKGGDPAVALDLTGCVVVLAVAIKKNTLFEVTTANTSGSPPELVLNASVGEITWTPTLLNSRKIPVGKRAKYELEVRFPSGEERSYVTGYLNGMGGIPSD